MQEWEVPIYTKSESMVMQALNLKKKVKRLKRELVLGQIATLTTYKKPTSLMSHVGGTQMTKKRYTFLYKRDEYSGFRDTSVRTFGNRHTGIFT